MIFEIVKKHIDKFDPMGFLSMGAPVDEYDIESKMISDRLTDDSSVTDVAKIIADVFTKMFDSKEDVTAYITCAQGIFNDLNA